VQSIELRHPINHGGNRGSELTVKVGNRHEGVFDGIVEKSGRNGGRIKAQPGSNSCNRYWVCDVGLAGLSHLLAMSRFRQLGRHDDHGVVFARSPLVKF
jgi:hypothetical protein